MENEDTSSPATVESPRAGGGQPGQHFRVARWDPELRLYLGLAVLFAAHLSMVLFLGATGRRLQLQSPVLNLLAHSVLILVPAVLSWAFVRTPTRVIPEPGEEVFPVGRRRPPGDAAEAEALAGEQEAYCPAAAGEGGREALAASIPGAPVWHFRWE